MIKNPFEIDYLNLFKIAEKFETSYKSSKPFPHTILDGFLTSKGYNKICKAFPKNNDEIWKTPTNVHTVGKSVTKNGSLGLKEFSYSEDARRFYHELNSSLFLTFLEKLTGIKNLLPDPYFSEGGFHKTTSGGYLDIHADFSHNDKLGLERRINLIFYLNDNWYESYGGELGLYDKNLTKVVSIAPIANRVAIFTTSDNSFHGYPERISCPAKKYRKSIAIYYYSLPTAHRRKSSISFPTDPEFTLKVKKS
ncbi:2OG-Fe(II) oxygenase [Alphaproteobacteria bacterium]|nr:2OG-Fe(II) oxygenase [Alphaproteobacteria bacterium]